MKLLVSLVLGLSIAGFINADELLEMVQANAAQPSQAKAALAGFLTGATSTLIACSIPASVPAGGFFAGVICWQAGDEGLKPTDETARYTYRLAQIGGVTVCMVALALANR